MRSLWAFLFFSKKKKNARCGYIETIDDVLQNLSLDFVTCHKKYKSTFATCVSWSCAQELCAWSLLSRNGFLHAVSVLVVVCSMSEASWLKKKHNQLSPVPDRQTGCDIHSLMPGEVHLSLSLSLLARTDSSLKQKRKAKLKHHFSAFFPVTFGFFMQAPPRRSPITTRSILLQSFQDGRDFQNTATVGNKGSRTTTSKPLFLHDTCAHGAV